MADAETLRQTARHPFIQAVHGVRYQVKDVARAVDFYTRLLGFQVDHQQLPAFASVSLGGATILLSGPGASGSRPLPTGNSRSPAAGTALFSRSPTCLD